jgi:hypothetical protein
MACLFLSKTSDGRITDLLGSNIEQGVCERKSRQDCSIPSPNENDAGFRRRRLQTLGDRGNQAALFA